MAFFFSEALLTHFHRLFCILWYEDFQKCSKCSETLRASRTLGKRTFVFPGSGLISRSFMLIRALEIVGNLGIFHFSPFSFDSPTPETTSIGFFNRFSSILDLFWRFEIFFFFKTINFFSKNFQKKIFSFILPSEASKMTARIFFWSFPAKLGYLRTKIDRDGHLGCNLTRFVLCDCLYLSLKSFL